MQAVSNSEFITGIFKQELKNRFLCEVNISGEDTVCYVPSSCHLGNFLKLSGKQVILVPTQTPGSRTKYALYAIPYKRSFILLNPSIANKAIAESIHRRTFSFLGKRRTVYTEHSIDGYKSDIFIADTNTIMEIKAIISTEENAVFPTVYSERSIVQLKKIKTLLESGFQACFCIVSLNPYVAVIELDRTTAFYEELVECINLGLLLKGFSCRFKQGKLVIDRAIKIKK